MFTLKEKKLGFSVIELLVVIAIISGLSAMALLSFSGFRNAQNLRNSQADIVSLFSESKTRTIASEDSSTFGIYLESSRVELFKGGTFSEPLSTNNQITLPSSIELSDITLSQGGNSIVFDRVSGAVGNYGTFVMRLVADTSESRIFTISQAGIISVTK